MGKQSQRLFKKLLKINHCPSTATTCVYMHMIIVVAVQSHKQTALMQRLDLVVSGCHRSGSFHC